ncbi:MAG: CHAT domain-containing protein [Thermoanaerobaculia bacterium]
MRRRSTVLLLLAGSLLVFSPSGGSEEPEDLLPGQPRERAIAEGETHIYLLDTTSSPGSPLLVTVEQQGIDLLLDARGPADREALRADAPNGRWGMEILLLPAGSAFRLEVRPGPGTVVRGRYRIEVEALPATPTPERAAGRLAALEALNRAGRLPFGTSEEGSRALAAYREVLAAWRSLGERRWEAEALVAVAALERQSGDLRASTEDYLQALELWRSFPAPHREAAVATALGLVRQRSGESAEARQALEQALALWQSLGERIEEALTRNALCLGEQASGSPAAALACFEKVLALHRELGNRSGEAAALNNLGGAYDLLGEPDAALTRYEQSLALFQALGDREKEAETLANLAVLHRTLGEWEEALRLYGLAREILATAARRSGEATLLNNVGFAYLTLGEPERALTLLTEALELRRAMGERLNEVITLNNLGLVRRQLGETGKALDHHRQALELAVALKDPRQEAMSRLRLAEAHLEQGKAAETAEALRELDLALAYFRDTGLRGREALALQVQGRALAQAGRPREALPKLQDVLARCRALRDRAGEAEALHALASVERTLELFDDAHRHADEAVARIEELRTGFVSPDLRAAFLATRRRAYELAIDLLMDRHAREPKAGHDREAFAKSEQARARTLLDVLQARAGAPGGAPAALLERRQSLRRRLSAKAAQQARQSGGARAEALEREMEPLLTDLDGVEAEIRRQDPRYAAFSEPPAITLAETAGLLDPGTLLLEYSLGEERSYLWAVDAGGLRSYVLPARQTVEDLVRKVYEDLSTVGAGFPRRGEEEALVRILLEPVWKETASVRHLVVVPDAALHVLPWSALQVPALGKPWDTPDREPLLERCEVVYLPSATTLAVQRRRLERRPPAPKWAAVLADPVFAPGDPRLGRPAGSPTVQADALLPRFERLPASRREAEEIASLDPAGRVRTLLDLSASRETVLSGELRAYRFLHFATHGVADTRSPELSGLVLSLVDAAGRPREGFLGLADIYDLDLSADLVVLSGCRTGIGREVRGEGLMGLTRGFLYAGVPRVVGSLWPVQDRTTAKLMSHFYKAMWQEGLSPAAALRKAQRSIREEQRYRAPYSWAGFVLQGDWRGEITERVTTVEK